ncbi:MAG: glycoside hydrolase family 3 protein [Treponema sp.]|nr:glycoside hydrolase family 3 protein [Treponema sp.]
MKDSLGGNFFRAVLRAVLIFIFAGFFSFGGFSEDLSPELDAALEDYLDSLSEREKISQIFLVSVAGNKSYAPVEDSSSIKSIDGDAKPLVPGGALFFAFNIGENPAETSAYIKSIADYCVKNKILRPYIAVDQEGGDVNRLRKITSKLPSPAQIADKLSPSQAYEIFSMQARQMRLLGFDMNLAPVSEALNDENTSFLQERSFGGIAQSVSYSLAFVSAFESGGVGTVLKHFPGNTSTDPHSGLPEIKWSMQRLQKEVLEPFYCVMGGKPSAVLMSHARTSAVDTSVPACLSRIWVNDILRTQLHYDGLIISDDIFMAALNSNGFPPELAAVQAIDAGVHVIMLSEKKFAAVAEDLLSHAETHPDFKKKLRDAEKKVLEFKLRCGILKAEPNATGGYVIRMCDDTEQNGELKKRMEDFAEIKEMGDRFWKTNSEKD